MTQDLSQPVQVAEPADRPAMTLFEHVPHPRIAARRRQGPPKMADHQVGFNGRLGAVITRSVGTMWAFYLVALLQIGWMALATWSFLHKVDPYPFPFLLFLGNIIQLLLMFVIMVGQQVLGGAADRRADQTYQDAEAILHEAIQIEEHLAAQDTHLLGQDEKLAGAIQRVDELVDRLEPLVPAPGKSSRRPKSRA